MVARAITDGCKTGWETRSGGSKTVGGPLRADSCWDGTTCPSMGQGVGGVTPLPHPFKRMPAGTQ